MIKQYQPNGNLVYIKEEKDVKDTPKYIKHNIETHYYNFKRLWVEGFTNCNNETVCKSAFKDFDKKPNIFKKYKIHSIVFYTEDKFVKVLVRFKSSYTLSKNFKLFRYKL